MSDFITVALWLHLQLQRNCLYTGNINNIPRHISYNPILDFIDLYYSRVDLLLITALYVLYCPIKCSIIVVICLSYCFMEEYSISSLSKSLLFTVHFLHDMNYQLDLNRCSTRFNGGYWTRYFKPLTSFGVVTTGYIWDLKCTGYWRPQPYAENMRRALHDVTQCHTVI